MHDLFQLFQALHPSMGLAKDQSTICIELLSLVPFLITVTTYLTQHSSEEHGLTGTPDSGEQMPSWGSMVAEGAHRCRAETRPDQKAGEVTSVWLTFSSLPFHSVQDPRPRHSTAHIQSRSSLISYPSLETPSQTDVCPRRCEIQPSWQSCDFIKNIFFRKGV